MNLHYINVLCKLFISASSEVTRTAKETYASVDVLTDALLGADGAFYRSLHCCSRSIEDSFSVVSSSSSSQHGSYHLQAKAQTKRLQASVNAMETKRTGKPNM